MLGKHIYIIDDEADIRLYLSTALEDSGFAVSSPGNAIPDPASVRQAKPDLICLDIMMPKQSGISLYKRLRNEPELRSTPIFVISGMTPAEDFMGEGFRKLLHDDSLPLPEGFIEKPIDIKRLIAMIGDWFAAA